MRIERKKAYFIIPAAGSSTRFGGESPKLFELLVGSENVLECTLRAVVASGVCAGMVVAARLEDIQAIEEILGRVYPAGRVVGGGLTRAGSVRAALESIPGGAELIAVHDGARPLCSAESIAAVVRAAAEHGAAIAASRSVDTVKRVSGDGIIIETIPRSEIYRAQTPQVFRGELLRRAYAGMLADPSAVTDDSHLVELLGEKVRIVEASPRDVKITARVDLECARALLTTRREAFR